MRLSSEVNDVVGIIISYEQSTKSSVADIPMHEHMTLVILKGFQILQIPGIGQCVQVDDL